MEIPSDRPNEPIINYVSLSEMDIIADRAAYGVPDFDLDDRLGIDPERPNDVVRKITFDKASPDIPPDKTLEDLLAEKENVLQQLAGGGVAVPPHDYTVERSWEEWPLTRLHQYVERIEGEQPNPYDPGHADHIKTISGALLNYLETVNPGELYDDGVAYSKHYRIGHQITEPEAQQGDQPFITNMEPQFVDMRRPDADTPPGEDRFAFSRAVERIRAMLDNAAAYGDEDGTYQALMDRADGLLQQIQQPPEA